MELLVRSRGGLLGLDRLVVVRGREVQVSERGVSTSRQLDGVEAALLDDAAARLLALPDVPVVPAVDVLDGGESVLHLVAPSGTLTLRVPAAAEAPDELWDLLALAERLAT